MLNLAADADSRMIAFRHPTDAERVAALDLIAAAFPNERAREPEVRAAVLSEPDYGADRSVVAVVDGQVAGYLACQESAVSLGGRWLPVAILGTVCVGREWRRTGLGRELVTRGAALATAAGATFLSPAPESYVLRFYESQGFVGAVRSRSLLELSSARSYGLAGEVVVRDAAPGDEAALAALYAAHYGPQTGTHRRTLDWWRRRLAGVPLLWTVCVPHWRVALRDGAIVAYSVSGDDDAQRIWEWAAEPGAEAEALALLAAEARDAGPRFAVCVSRHDPLWPALRPLLPLDCTPPRGPVMVRCERPEVLGPPLAAVLADRDAELVPGDRPTVECALGRLTTAWSRLLALVFDGRDLEKQVSAGLVELTPAATPAAWQRVLPVRESTRRITDAF